MRRSAWSAALALPVAAAVLAPGSASAAPLAPAVTATVTNVDGPGSVVALTVANPYPKTPGFTGWCYATVTSWPFTTTVWQPSSPPGTPATPPTAQQIKDAGFAVAGESVTVDIPLPGGLYLATGTCLSPEGTTTTERPAVLWVWPG